MGSGDTSGEPKQRPRSTDGADALSLEAERRAHAYARSRGLLRALYASIVLPVSAVLRLLFRVQIFGRENIPRNGPAIIAPNHKNFFDVFFIAMATRRPVRYMAKVELFSGPLGWLFPRVGAFPVRRGGADTEALKTAREILAAGGLVVVFPEGTRVEAADVLGSPHHGAGRLALQSGAPIIPTAITGTSHLWRGAIPKTKRVQLAFLPAIASQPSLDGHDSASLIDELVWPAVQEKYGSLRAGPGLIAACLAAIGVGGGFLARRKRAIRRRPELLGTVEPRKVRRDGHKRRTP
ncbi:MAG: lysophospholipid acyltransferase family protein [Solirubrobacteraceae bacterium]